MLGAIGSGASDVWPARGFALGPLGQTEGDIKLSAKRLTLGGGLPVENASVAARLDKDGLTLSELKGKLFGGAFAASGKLRPRGAGASAEASVELARGSLDLLSKGVVGPVLAKGPFSLKLYVQGEGLSPLGLVAGLSGEGTLELEPGMLLALSADPLKRMAVEAAKGKKVKVDKDQIAAFVRSMRDRLTRGTYKYYAAATLPLEVKNGTLRFKQATLASAGAEALLNGYIELASLRLDSEWVLRLPGGEGMPSISVVFAGPLNKAGTISPAVDVDAIASYLTMRRMQEDVETLENLDVSGPNLPRAEPKPQAEGNAPSQPGLLVDAKPAESAPEPSDQAEAPQPPPPPPAPQPKAAGLEHEHHAPKPKAEPVPPNAAKAQPNADAKVEPQSAPQNSSVTGEPISTPSPETAGEPQGETRTTTEPGATPLQETAPGIIATEPAPVAGQNPRRRGPNSLPDNWKKGSMGGG
jgi:hypothetical protein